MSVTVIVRTRFPHARSVVLERAARITEKAAFDVEAGAKARAPVDTGYLRNAINANGRGLNWRVDSPALYSVYQELGTRRMPAHPYMIPALEAVRPSYLAALRHLA